MTRRLLALALSCSISLLAGCGGGSSKSSSSTSSSGTTSGQNVLAITVNSGPTGNYVNGAFASVEICVPSTSTCQTIDGILVDTGSVGLRILSSALTLTLPQQKGISGNPVVECLPFVNSYTWGPVQSADVHLAGETASSLPIQVISDTAYAVASGCTDMGLSSADTLDTLGANGILGVGLFLQDCGGACVQTGSSNPGLYYECASSGCQVTAESTSSQVQNPVALFAGDNNGVLIKLPAVSSTQASLSGSLIFGIGTQSNNALGSATVYALNSDESITTVFKGQSYPESFLDSGSNGLFFLDSGNTGLPNCSDASGFYCPSSTQNLSATNSGANGSSAAISFSVANADSLFSNQSAFVFNQLGGPNPGSLIGGYLSSSAGMCSPRSRTRARHKAPVLIGRTEAPAVSHP